MRIFKNYKDFLENKKEGENGITQKFLDENNLKIDEIILIDCFHCFNCNDCIDCNNLIFNKKWKLISKKPNHKSKEMTKEEICKELRRKIKIVK